MGGGVLNHPEGLIFGQMSRYGSLVVSVPDVVRAAKRPKVIETIYLLQLPVVKRLAFEDKRLGIV